MNFRSVIGHDLQSTLESSDHHEMPVDRLAAFSRAERLGTLLWRLKWGHDATSFQPAVEGLSEATGQRSALGVRLCGMLVWEWLNPNCENCKGARELIAGERRIVCPKCEGLGIKRYSDRERARYMNMSLEKWRKLSGKVKPVVEVLTKAERQVSARMHLELER